MSIAVLRKKTKFKSRSTGNRVDYKYTGQPKGLAYTGFSLNMSNRGSITGSKYNNGKLTGIAARCSQCNTLNAANERQSNCRSCNPQAVAKQLSYRNYMTRARSSVSSIAGYRGKGNGIRARVIDSTGRFKDKAEVWKRGPSFDTSSYIDNKKSTVLQCTQPGATDAAGLPHGCTFPNQIEVPRRNTCSVTMGKTTYIRMYDIPCNTAKQVLNITASDQIARVKARRVCKADGGVHCSDKYESNIMHDNLRKVC